MSFAQIYRLMQSLKITDQEQWRKVRLIAYEVWRKDTKNPPGIDSYMPIYENQDEGMTKKKLDAIWKKYGRK